MLTENANRVSFDDRLNQQARVEDLSRELMCDFLKEVGSDLADRTAQLPLVELGRQMNVVSGSVEAPFPLNVGLLFFNPEPHRFFFFPATQIDVVWLPKGAGGEKITERVFRGPAPKMLRESLDYISETVIKHHDRAEATRGRAANTLRFLIGSLAWNGVYWPLALAHASG